MDNETTRSKMPSNGIERIVIFISDIFEKIMLSENPPFIIKNKQLTKQDLFVKIKEKVDITIIDDKVKKVNEDFSKLFTIKNNYPNLLLKINRILLIFGEEKITKIYELVKYIANIETSKINNIHLISRDKSSQNKYSDNSNSNLILEEYLEFEKIKSFKNQDYYKTINYSNITNISEIQRKHNCLRNSATKSQNSCDSLGNKDSKTFLGMPNIKCIKDKNLDKRRFDSNSNMNNSKEKNLSIVENQRYNFANENKDNVINNAPIMLYAKLNLNNDKANFKNIGYKTNNKLADKELFSRDKFNNYNEIENYRNISEDKNKNEDSKMLVSEKYKSIIQKEDINKLNKTLNHSINNQAGDKITEYLGKKTLRTNNPANEYQTSDDNSKNNHLNYNLDKSIKNNNEKEEIQNLELKENTDYKDNFYCTQIPYKLLNPSEVQKEDIVIPENNKDINYNFSDAKKNSDLFNNKRFDDIFNLDCNFENAEDMINFDCFSNGIFSNKEITFDDNNNSEGEESDKKNPADIKANEYNNSINNKNSVDKEFLMNGEKKDKIKEITKTNENMFITDSALMNKNYKEQTINESYKFINEKQLYVKKNMNILKNFFNQKAKTDNNTIKSIDDSTTVSTQFTKEKNSTKNSQKSQTYKIDFKTNESQIPIVNNYSNNQLTSYGETKTPCKNFFLNLNKNYTLDKEENYSKNITSGVKTHSVISDGNHNKGANYNRIYLDNSNQLLNTNNLKIKSTHKPNKINSIDNEKKEISDIISNVSINLNSSSTSKEKNLNNFCIQNDFRKSYNNKGDSQSNEIYKNLLATAKYFDLDD